MTLIQELTNKYPDLKRKLLVAHVDKKPEEYVKEKLMSALYMGAGLGVLSFFLLSKREKPILGLPPELWAIPIALIGFWIMFNFLMRHVDSMILRRAKDIDREVLFAGRFLLIKLNTGQPLVNAITEASKSYGVAAKYFSEIVRDIDMGTPLEDSLDKAAYFTPSARFKRILFQLTNALKTGIDPTEFLQAILDEIADEQLIEIQRYGKKLNTMTLFYMLMAIVLPSLGLTILIVVSGLLKFQIDVLGFSVIIILLIIIQVVFLTLFKFIRPNVNI